MALRHTALAVAAVIIGACTSEADGTLGIGGSGKRNDGTKQESDVSSSSSTNATPTATGLPCDVDAVLKSKCQTCHAAEPKYGASTSLVTYGDLQKERDGKKVFDLVKARIHDEARPMPPTPNPRLAADEAGKIDAWIGAGAKASDATCTNEAPKDEVKPLSCKPDTVLKAAKPFTMQAGGALDQYVCFGVDINVTKKRHVTALAPKVDNKKILHHILLFQAPDSESSDPFPCDAFGSAAWKLVAGWAPGGNNLELPPEAGFPQEQGTTHWVLQLHYNNALNLAGATDQSGYEMCTTDQLRANDAGVLAFGSTKFSIPPRADHRIRCDYTLDNKFQGVKFFNASPHMHTRGASMSTERLPGGANGTPEMIFEQKKFDFENQANFPINASVAPGDVLRTRCGWKNGGDTTIGFGEGTGDEMCFDFIGYYPNIPDRTFLGLPVFTWITPSSSAKCTTE
jgi:hypothetical protein